MSRPMASTGIIAADVPVVPSSPETRPPRRVLRRPRRWATMRRTRRRRMRQTLPGTSSAQVLDVGEGPVAAGSRLQQARLAAGPEDRSGVLRVREVREVEGVLRADVAADVALAAQLTRESRGVMEVGPRLGDRTSRR